MDGDGTELSARDDVTDPSGGGDASRGSQTAAPTMRDAGGAASQDDAGGATTPRGGRPARRRGWLSDGPMQCAPFQDTELPDYESGEEGSAPRETFLHVFSGQPRAGSFEDAGAQLGVEVISIDTLLGGRDHDVRRPEVRDGLLRLVRSGRVSVVWIGTPCASFSVLWQSGDQAPPRTRQRPDGADGLPAWQQEYVLKHNAFVEFTVELARAAYESVATYVIENPVDYGMTSSPYFRWAARAHCPLWLHSAIRRLAAATQPTWATGCQCMLGGDFRKATTLMAAGPRAERLTPFRTLFCTHASHARVAFGRDDQGRLHSAAAAAYPVEMCQWVMVTLYADDSVEARAFAATAQATAAKEAAASLHAANSRAARAFLDERPGDGHEAGDGGGDGGAPSPLEWRSAPGRMPLDWPEREDALGGRLRAARETTLRFISRRRAEAEDPEKLARRPMPVPHPVPDVPAQQAPRASSWPEGAPPRPIRIDQLYLPGVYAEIRAELQAHSAEIADCVGRARAGASVRLAKRETRIYTQEQQPTWARGILWDTSDVADCVPMQPYSAADRPQQGARHAFFEAWGAFLSWPDADMLQQVTLTGVESRARMELSTVIMSHHGGLRGDLAPADTSIAHDTSAGWMTQARLDLWTVPTRFVPKNVVHQDKWRYDDERNLVRKRKVRITTDDSVAPQADARSTDSRNDTIDRSAWGDVPLTSPMTLSEAVAIVKATTKDMDWRPSQVALERVALWAIDLSDAYRALAVSRMEWWQQGVLWAGGAKVDRRCVFGSAHMVDFFQRVSTFILAVAKRRVDGFDEAHPYAAARAAWQRWRADVLGGVQSPAFAMVYLDDGSGCCPLARDEPLHGAPPGAPAVRAYTSVEPAPHGGGVHVRLFLFVNKSRPECHLSLVETTCEEAGWGIAADKKQLGFEVDLLGVAVSTSGEGCVYAQEAKREGIRRDIAAMLGAPRGVAERQDIEQLTGRCSNLAQVVCEGNAYLQPMYRFQNAQWTVKHNGSGAIRVKPRRLAVIGTTPNQVNFERALRWWDAALATDVRVPLAPRLVFPGLDEAGSAYLFTDAAREDGTGYGAHSTVTVGGHAFFIFREQRWARDTLLALQSNAFSMPAGECFGAVMFADALVRALGSVTHLTVFTDSDATAKAFTAAGSGAPQLNHMVEWLLRRHPRLQLLGVWQPGKRNDAADGLSRDRRTAVLQQAQQAGAELVELQLSSEDQAAATQLLAGARAQPLRR